ncbi:MAG: CotH kinase family protein [Caldisericaceae bacterium]|nr:CotH kinase family protein [Caldisericaceae bacterium]
MHLKKINVNLFLLFIFWFTIVNRAQSTSHLSEKVFDDRQVAIIEIEIEAQYLDYLFNPDNAQSDSLFPCTVHFRNVFFDTTIANVGFRLRGNTSRNAQKKSFKLSFNTFEKGRKFATLEKLNLNGEHNDPSIIRSKLCWDFFRKIDLHGSQAAHAALYINGAYYGLYIMVEHVDEQFLKKYFDYANGNLWKCLWPADLTYRGDEPSNYYPYFDEERPYQLKTNVQKMDYRPLARLARILEKTLDEQLVDSLVSFMDIKDVLKYFSTNLLTGSWDDYWSLMNNYYLYYDFRAGKMHLIPYDYDNTFGIDFFGIDWAEANIYHFPKVSDGPRPLAERIMAHPTLRNLYSHFLQFYRDSVFAPYLWLNRIDSLKDRITPFAQQDTFYHKDYGFTFQDFENSYGNSHYENQHVKYGLKEFIWRRYYTAGSQLEFLPAKPVVYQVDIEPPLPAANDSIRINVLAFGYPPIQTMELILQRGNSTNWEVCPFSKANNPGSLKIEDHDRWSVKISPLLETGVAFFQIKATNSQGQSTYYPARGGLKITTSTYQVSNLKLNELLAKNDQSNVDPAGEYDDWLEIFNNGTDKIELAGLYLTDDPQNLTKWRFPDTTSALAGGAFRVIWCDEDAGQQGLHASFKLAASGEFLALVAADGRTILDSLSFGAQQADQSLGRYPDGFGNWQTMLPTPGKSNLPTAVETTTIMAKDFQLQIFPNPFNARATIKFYLPASEKISMTIYDLKGTCVWKNKPSLLPAGWHQTIWQGKNEFQQPVASGLYFLVVKGQAFSLCKKLVLLK